jgi:hypothetical protein
MGQGVTRDLVRAGWRVHPEVSFNWYGERGAIDLVAWFPATRTLLLIELKTELVDIGLLLATHDRRVRLAAEIARSLGLQPLHVASWIVVADGRTNRRVVERHRDVIRAALPSDGRTIRGWSRRPDRPIRALSFWPDSAPAGHRSSSAPVRRVRVRSAPLR